ncbi:MAG: hypothetical protein ACR2J3_13345 [Aridibacter sp.]
MSKFFTKKKIIPGIFLCVVSVAGIFSATYVYKNTEYFSGEIIITDADFREAEGKEITITDEDFTDYKEIIKTVKESRQEAVKVLRDKSEVFVSYDGYGNKSITRFFSNDPLLKKIMLRIAADGRTQVFVYAQNGKVEGLPDNMINKILNSSAAELANSTQIYETREDRDRRAEEIARRRQEELKPLPSNEFPVDKQNFEFPKMEQLPQSADNDDAESPKQSEPQKKEENTPNEDMN